MLKRLDNDYNLRGYSFEYIARILLRRQNNNNFIFLSSRFDDLNEILIKYKLQTNNNSTKDILSYINQNWNRFDIIEFKLNNKEERIIENINIYEVKTKFHTINKNYFEFCISNYKFCHDILLKYNIDIKIISMTLFENWKFSFNIKKFSSSNIKLYSNFKK